MKNKHPVLGPLAALLLGAGCVEQLPLVGAPCPCASGTVCDVTGTRCVPESSNPHVDAAAPADVVAPADRYLGPPEAPPEPYTPPPTGSQPDLAGCKFLGLATADEVESRFIAPRCGVAMCHGPMSVFPPRNLDNIATIRNTLVGQKAALACKNDYYINVERWEDSFLLHKIQATGPTVACPSTPERGDSGGTRMPNQTYPLPMPTIVGERLTAPEIDCLRWWVWSLTRN